MIDKFYKQTCPFCQKDNEQRLHINIICRCGAKYYFTLENGLIGKLANGYGEKKLKLLKRRHNNGF